MLTQRPAQLGLCMCGAVACDLLMAGCRSLAGPLGQPIWWCWAHRARWTRWAGRGGSPAAGSPPVLPCSSAVQPRGAQAQGPGPGCGMASLVRLQTQGPASQPRAPAALMLGTPAHPLRLQGECQTGLVPLHWLRCCWRRPSACHLTPGWNSCALSPTLTRPRAPLGPACCCTSVEQEAHPALNTHAPWSGHPSSPVSQCSGGGRLLARCTYPCTKPS